MRQSEELRQFLLSIDHKGYPAYKGTKGTYRFPDFILSIDHVQGDPFASPSRISIQIEGKKAGFPSSYFDQIYKKLALEDCLLRTFGDEIEPFNFRAKGSGKSGLLTVSRPGQEILKRTACSVDENEGSILVRMEAGFPARGRTIDSLELILILFEYLPKCVKKSCLYGNYSIEEKEKVEQVIQLSKDQNALREQLSENGLIAFVANGSILPRGSGVSKKPMKQAVAFESPSSMEVEMNLPVRGKVRGMGIPKGVTLIVGGGYHGKSTLLEALESGVYDHILGDGRELVVTDSFAVKLRSEDGRSVKQTDISLFISNLPDKRDTVHFCTQDASGSTSQAAGVVEAIESGTSVFLIDEDNSATNFMLRDRLMQQVVNKDKEPITPFIERIRGLYEQEGISTILVAGSSGAFFHVADYVIQMDAYVPREITAFAKETAQAYGETAQSTEMNQITTLHIPKALRTGGNGERVKVKILGQDSLQIDKEIIDLRYVEQIADTEQIAALGYLLKYGGSRLIDGKKPLATIVDELEMIIRKDGLASLAEGGYLPIDLALPRRQEIFAAFLRCRSLMY